MNLDRGAVSKINPVLIEHIGVFRRNLVEFILHIYDH